MGRFRKCSLFVLILSVACTVVVPVVNGQTALVFTSTTLPNGAVTVPYGAELSKLVTGGMQPYTFAVTTPPLPAGFSMTTTQSGNVNAGHVFSTPAGTGPTTAGTFTFGVMVTDSTPLAPQSAAAIITLTIGPAPANTQAPLLKGRYGLLFQSFSDSVGDEEGDTGSLVFDGVGGVTGIVDLNNTTAISLALSVTGTYSVGPDNRLFMALTAAGMPGTFYVAGAVGNVYRGVALTVRLTQFNNNDGNDHIGSGFLRLQDTTAFTQNSIAGTYILGFTGQTPGLLRVAVAGLISFDNALKVTSGSGDENDAGTVTSITSITGTYTAPDANGRIVLSLTIVPGGAATVVVYIISANELVVMTLDPRANNNLMIGSAWRQPNPGTFSNASLAGPDIVRFLGLQSGVGTHAVVGLGTVSGGMLTVTFDQNNAGTVATNQTLVFTYTVAANGRVSATASTTASFILYLAVPDRGFFFVPDNSVGFGEVVPQVGAPFSASPLNGNFFFGEQETLLNKEALSGIAVLAPPGTFNITVDDSHSGGQLNFGQTANFAITVASNGHFTAPPGPTISGQAGYLTSPFELSFLDIGGPTGTSMHPDIILAQSLAAPPGTPSPAATTVNFATPVAVGATAQSAPITFTNTGLGPMAFTGTNTTASPDFSASGTCFGAAAVVVIQPGGTCTIIITFAPTGSAPTGTPLNETLIAQTDGTTNVTFTLTGTVISMAAAVTLSPPSVNFGAVNLGTPSTATVTLTNSGTATLTITSITVVGTNAADFMQSNNCPTLTVTLAVGASCTITITFTPSAPGNESATLQVASNATVSTVTVALSGLGVSTSAGFSLTPTTTTGGTPTTATVLPGDTAVFTIVLQPNPGFVGPITVTCVSGIPATIATASPTTINVTTTPSPAVTITCMLQTNCTQLVGPREPWPQPGPSSPVPVGAMGALALLVALSRRHLPQRWAMRLAPALVLLLLVMTWTACVSNPPPAIPGAPRTPAGVYQIQVVATAPGGVKQIVTLNVRVI